MNKRAFTLAELLISMSIIGFIAVIVLSKVNTIMPNESMAKFKKAYSVTGRIVSALVDDVDLYPDGVLSDTSSAYFRGDARSGDTKFCNLFAEMLNVNSTVSCSPNSDDPNPNEFTTGNLPTQGRFTTTDGMVWLIPKTTFENDVTIYIDVNGDELPNCIYSNADTLCSCRSEDENTDALCNKQEPDRFQMTISKEGIITIPEKGPEQYYMKQDTPSARFNKRK